MKKLLSLALVAGIGAVAVTMWPDIQRYLKIRDM
ncbi:MAG: DUF6893 family small protein [Iamia sp.]